MITCKLALCAESVVRDVESNRMSIFNIFEGFKSHGFPIGFPKYACFFFLAREEGDNVTFEASLGFHLNESSLKDFPVNVNFEDKMNTRVVINVLGLVIPGPGILSTRLMYEGRELGRWDIKVGSIEEVTGTSA
jgi:hypothetical protein